jgi:hypothetical protein
MEFQYRYKECRTAISGDFSFLIGWIFVLSNWFFHQAGACSFMVLSFFNFECYFLLTGQKPAAGYLP